MRGYVCICAYGSRAYHNYLFEYFYRISNINFNLSGDKYFTYTCFRWDVKLFPSPFFTQTGERNVIISGWKIYPKVSREFQIKCWFTILLGTAENIYGTIWTHELASIGHWMHKESIDFIIHHNISAASHWIIQSRVQSQIALGMATIGIEPRDYRSQYFWVHA